MPNTRSAEKALRQSKKRAAQNLVWKTRVKESIKIIKTGNLNPDILDEQYSKLQSYLDKAVKNNVIHKNKAARLKSRVYKTAHAKPSSTSTSRAKSKSN